MVLHVAQTTVAITTADKGEDTNTQGSWHDTSTTVGEATAMPRGAKEAEGNAGVGTAAVKVTAYAKKKKEELSAAARTTGHIFGWAGTEKEASIPKVLGNEGGQVEGSCGRQRRIAKGGEEKREWELTVYEKKKREVLSEAAKTTGSIRGWFGARESSNEANAGEPPSKSTVEVSGTAGHGRAREGQAGGRGSELLGVWPDAGGPRRGGG